MQKIQFVHHRIVITLLNLISLCWMLLTSQSISQPLATGHSKFLGCCAREYIPNPFPKSFTALWNQVTPENSGKWQSVEPGRDDYRWDNLDMVYNYAQSKDLLFRLHVLVWGKQQPAWITDLDSAEQADEVEQWFAEAGFRYPDADYVEVVNEAIEFPPYDYYPPYRNALGGAGQTGWDWVIWAFEKARVYFPNSKLYLNEYNIFGGSKSINTYLTIINLLKERNLIDGFCEQGHFLESVSKSTIQSRLDQLATAGLPIQISEFDINIADDARQLAKYKEIFPILWEHPAVEGITLWGYKQDQLWRTDSYLLRSDGTERPALLWLREYLAETSVEKSLQFFPTACTLYQNYPNPFNPTTTIRYSLEKPSQVQVKIYNTHGQTVKRFAFENRESGEHQIRWDGTDESGQQVAAGVYVYELSTDLSRSTKKMILMK